MGKPKANPETVWVWLGAYSRAQVEQAADKLGVTESAWCAAVIRKELERLGMPPPPARVTVLDRVECLLSEQGPMRSADIARALELEYSNIASVLHRAAEAGRLVRVARGTYGLPERPASLNVR